MRRPFRRSTFGRVMLGLVAIAPWILPSCSSGPPTEGRVKGQSEFTSAPPYGQAGSRDAGGYGGGAGGTMTATTSTGGADAASGGERTVEETDLYRLDGDRLYFLNGYRGLLVFDVSTVDQPKLVGRSPIYGQPVEMIVRDGVATVVVADWYGTMSDGKPFHGSVVRGLDARDPSNIKVLGEARLGGWISDTRVVGDVLYAVSHDYYGSDYGFAGAAGVSGDVATSTGTTGGGSGSGAAVAISSVSFANGQIQSKGYQSFSGYSGIFNVTSKAILMAHGAYDYQATAQTSELQYVDISDPGGTIALRGKQTVSGLIQGWGQDNGRWNLDFADSKTAHVLTLKSRVSGESSYLLTTVDWSDPAAPTKASELDIDALGWSPAARFDSGRMYLAPTSSLGGYGVTTPVQIYDLAKADAPKLAGSTTIPGYAWALFPAANRLFALGTQYLEEPYYQSVIALSYLDVADATKPKLLGTSRFGDGWGWTPAMGTFKAFTRDAEKGLVVLPFSSWSYEKGDYFNGLQLIEFTPTTIATKGAARTKGWVERGIFVKDRLVSLSDLALSVVDYTDRDKPKVVRELTLARNIISAQPQGDSVALLSTDWWGNDRTTSELRVVPTAEVEDDTNDALSTVTLDGTQAKAYRNGAFTYVVTYARREVPCPVDPGGTTGGTGGGNTGAGGAPTTTVTTTDTGTTETTTTVTTTGTGTGTWTGTTTTGTDTGTGTGTDTATGTGTDTTTSTTTRTSTDTGKPDEPMCSTWTTVTQVIELKDGKALLRGKVELPRDAGSSYWGWGYGWGGCYAYDWYDGSETVQVGGDALAFRRWSWTYDSSRGGYVGAGKLYVVDLSNPDAPTVASTTITPQDNSWWGNLRAVGTTLYASHYEWTEPESVNAPTTDTTDKASATPTVRYFLDRIDLSDRRNPKVGAKINVPGILVGASETDPTLLYTIDYRWYGESSRAQLAVLKVDEDTAYLQGTLDLDGYVGRVFVRGSKAYTTIQRYYDSSATTTGGATVSLYELDLSDPAAPTQRVSTEKQGFGWLLGVEGDRAIVTSGWGNAGLDIYKLHEAAPPTFEQFVRTRGYWSQSLARQGNTLFLSSGYWGVQAIELQ